MAANLVKALAAANREIVVTYTVTIWFFHGIAKYFYII
jgi:hypothetical protein